MEHHDPTRRQYVPTSYAAQQPQQGTSQNPAYFATPASIERFRQSAHLQQSPLSVSAPSRANSDAQTLYGFSQGLQYGSGSAMPANTMQYGQDYTTTAEMQRAQQPQQSPTYPHYTTSTIYGMPQTQAPQQTTQSPYDQMSQYRQRPSAAAETLGTQFGEPQTAQYYLAGQGGPTSAPSSELAAQSIPSQYQPAAYAQPGPSTTHSYPSAMIDSSQTPAYQVYGQVQQYGGQQQTQSVDQAFDEFWTDVRTIFSHVRESNLRDLPRLLTKISQYLLGQAEALELTLDPVDGGHDGRLKHDERIKLWDEFNKAWLATLQRQFDMTSEMLPRGHQVQDPQSIMTKQSLERLAQELVRLCDLVESSGLVDYQMGVAEEDIMDLILRCLSVFESNEQEGHQNGSSATGAVRAR